MSDMAERSSKDICRFPYIGTMKPKRHSPQKPGPSKEVCSSAMALNPMFEETGFHILVS